MDRESILIVQLSRLYSSAYVDGQKLWTTHITSQCEGEMANRGRPYVSRLTPRRARLSALQELSFDQCPGIPSRKVATLMERAALLKRALQRALLGEALWSAFR